VALSVLGIMAINALAGPTSDAGPAPLLGNALVLAAVAAESLFLLLRKRLPSRLTALGASTWLTVLGLAQFLPLAAWQALDFDFGAVGWEVWATIGYYGVAVTVLAYLFWFRGIVAVPASVAGVFTGVLPVSALALSWLVLDQPLGWEHLAGCGCVLAGVACISGVRPGAMRSDLSRSRPTASS